VVPAGLVAVVAVGVGVAVVQLVDFVRIVPAVWAVVAGGAVAVVLLVAVHLAGQDSLVDRDSYALVSVDAYLCATKH